MKRASDFGSRSALSTPSACSGHELGVAAEQDVGAAAGHVGGDRDRAEAAGLGDDLGLVLVVLGVQHDVLDAAAPAACRRAAPTSRPRPCRPGPAGRPPASRAMSSTMASNFSRFGLVDDVGLLDAGQRPVGRHDHDVELVDLVELLGLGVGRAGHAGELVVHAEVVLEGDGGERLVLALDLHLLLGLDGLVQAVAPAAARHQAAGELVDDDDLAVLDDVVDVALEEGVGAQALLHVVQQRHVGRVVEAARLQAVRERLSACAMPLSVSVHRLVLLVDDEVAGRLERFALLGLDLALRDGAELQAAG